MPPGMNSNNVLQGRAMGIWASTKELRVPGRRGLDPQGVIHIPWIQSELQCYLRNKTPLWTWLLLTPLKKVFNFLGVKWKTPISQKNKV